MSENIDSNSGFVAIVGRPNVGKSTLLNKIIGEKVSITADKPQTTRHKILGVSTVGTQQAVYIDTPGIHKNDKKAINKYMNRAARSAIYDVDVVLFVVEAGTWTDEDQTVLELLNTAQQKADYKAKIFLVVNKVDLLADKAELLPYIEMITKQLQFASIIPLSASTGDQVEVLQKNIFLALPIGPHYFPTDMVTDRDLQFRIAEIIREKLFRNLGKELPYAVTVEIERIEQTPEQKVIYAAILVERSSQKQIVIGARGSKLKTIGAAARHDINKLLNCRCHLQLWVKVRDGWADDQKALGSLGYSMDADQ